MKRKITLLLLAAGSVLTMNSQVVLPQENFTEPFNPATNGWVVTNLSAPSNTISWTQGNQTGGNGMTAAYNGNTDDFYCADFFSVPGGQAGGISAWLITPSMQLYNGAILQFATTTLAQSTASTFPDRLQVRMAQSNNTVIPTGTTSVGAFTSLLLDINPGLSTSTSSTVVGNSVAGFSVMGYPQAWTVYSVVATGITGTVTGRFAFRYFVDNGGQNGLNSRFVGIDAVKVTAPCGTLTAQSYTTCANSPVNLSAQGGIATTSYSWSGPSGAAGNTQNITVNAPASGSAVYTVEALTNGTLCGVSQTATVTQSSLLSVNIVSSASSNTICSNRVFTLTANAAANTFSWSSGQTTSAITITTSAANPSTTYSVGAQNGLCFGGNTITINVIASPSLTYAVSAATVCPGAPFTFSTSGAATYTYALGLTIYTVGPTATFPGTFVTAITNGPGNYGVNIFATGSNGCLTSGQEIFTLGSGPTITAVPSKTPVCRNTTYSITADGADTYTFSGTGVTTTTNNPLSYSTGTAGVGTRTINIGGTDENGCTATTAFTVQVYTCTGIENIDGSGNASVYPNPFGNELTISGISGNVEIYNTLGQVVIKTRINDDETINTADLKKGIYILKAYNSDGTITKTVRLLKN